MRKFAQTLSVGQFTIPIQLAAKELQKRGYRFRGVTIKGKTGISFDRYVFGQKGKDTVYLSELTIERKGVMMAHSYALNPHGLEPKGLDKYLN